MKAKRPGQRSAPTLPAPPAVTAALLRSRTPATVARSGANPPTGAPHILLVDDDPAVRESLRRVLVSQGWVVATAAGGVEALEFLRQSEPDLVITDLRMDAVNGWDLLFHESLQRPHLPIFVITALARHAVAGADQFAAEFFEKPLDFDELLAAVRRRLAGRRRGQPPA